MARSLLSEILMIFLGFSVKQISEGAGILSSDSVELLLLYIFYYSLYLNWHCTTSVLTIRFPYCQIIQRKKKSKQ